MYAYLTSVDPELGNVCLCALDLLAASCEMVCDMCNVPLLVEKNGMQREVMSTPLGPVFVVCLICQVEKRKREIHGRIPTLYLYSMLFLFK